MRIKEKLVGVLEVLNKRQGAFDEEDVRHITILASQAAVAIENAQLVAALRQANEELSKLDKLKSDFIAIASHELRTPLGIILGYASFLKEEAEGTASEHAEAVLNSALHLRSLIEAMTNLRFVQIDKSELTIREVPLNLILRGAYADVQSLAETRRHAVTLALPERAVQVRADLHMMTMALTNVLNNAVKFTPEGGEIAVSFEEHPPEVWIRVRDTGIGLPADQLDLIFDQFYQVEDPMTRQHEGLGLGLSISRAILERHGGRIWAESAGPGRGSLFTLTIPLAGAP
jgi:signal transduction histidine kinase